MAQITMVFEGFTEMLGFARELLGISEVNGTKQATQGKEERKTPVTPAGLQQTVTPDQTDVPVQTTVPVQAVATTQETYTLDELASAAMTLMDRGMQAQLMELLGSYGIEALPQLPEAKFGEFATALRGLGAQI